MSLPGGVRLYEMLTLRGCTMRMGQWETAELEGGSSSGRAQSSVQFLFYTEGKKNSVKDWKEQVMQTHTPVGKIPLPASWRNDGRGALTPCRPGCLHIKEKAGLWPRRKSRLALWVHAMQTYTAGCVCIFALEKIVFPHLARVYSVSSSMLSHWVLPNLWDNGSNVTMSFPFYKR